MALVVTIDAIDRTSVLVDDSLSVEQQAADFVSICSLTLVDEDGDITITAEDAITIVDGATTFFSGRVVDIRYSLFTTVSRYIHIKCQDLNAIVGETVLDNEEVFSAVADSAIIDSLFDDYLPAVDSETHVDTLQDPLTITFITGTLLRNALSQICTRTGGYFYVDFDNKLHYFDAESDVAGFWLSEDPEEATVNYTDDPILGNATLGQWAITANLTGTRDTDHIKFGTHAMKLVPTGGGAANYFNDSTWWRDEATFRNNDCAFSCWVYMPAGTDNTKVFIRAYEDDGGGYVTLGTTIAPATFDQWVRLELSVTVGGAANDVWFRIHYNSADITKPVWFDGFQLEKKSAPTKCCYGSRGAGHTWSGTAHESTSIRTESFSYFATGVDKTSLATTRLDGVYVIGDGIEGWRGTHAPGDRQAVARDLRITTATGRDERGDSILARYGDTQVTYKVSTYQAGLIAGMDVGFLCDLYGVNDTFTVRKMTVRWDKAGVAYYILTLGDVVNPSLISERIWIDTLPQALGPVTAPRLPTSSRGWSHNIVFSATDHDTVAWAAAGVITLADGTAYTIDAGNTGNMAATTYIYLDLDTSETVLQTTADASVAVGSKKIMLAWAKNQAAGLEATFLVFGGSGQNPLVDTSNIADDAITTGKILANTILAGDIAANTITAGQIAAATITANEIAANTIVAGNIAAGAIETDELDALAVTAAKIAANTITADKISMGIGDEVLNEADGLLLLGPHCEINTTEWWSARKQKATISGAFHQEAGRWLGTRGLVVEEATTNLILNPSFEVDTTGWTLISSTISRDTTYSMFGDAALKVVTDNAVANEGVRDTVTDETAASTEYTLSCYLRGEGTVYLWFFNTDLGYQFGSAIPLTNTWTRHELTKTFTTGIARTVGVMTTVQQDITFYCDGFQLEEQDYATSYTDGTLGTGYAWTGAAHGSTSTRTKTEIALDAHVGLINDNATLSFRIIAQMPYDADATWPAAFCIPYDMRAGADNNNRIALQYVMATDTWRLYINGANRCISAAQTFKAGDWLDIIATLDFTTDDYNLYIDGLLADNDTTALVAPTGLDQFNLGSYITGTGQGGFNVVEFAVFDRVLTAIEVAGMYALQRPLIDMGSLDKPGIYILDGAFKIASSTSGNRIDITADEIAGYDSGGTKQFYLQASDGKAIAGGGSVRLDETGISLLRDGAIDDTQRLVFYYNDAGTERVLGRFFGDWGGAGSMTSWVQAWRIAGDPWTGAKVTLAAIDNVAATDIRITVDSSGLISIGGDELRLAGDVYVDSGVVVFQAVTGLNEIQIPNAVADALHIVDAGALEWLRIITTGGVDSFIIDPAGAGIKAYVGMMNTPNAIFGVGLPTENFELIDAGSAGATQQDWIEVEIGGVQGYLHVFAAK